MTTDINDQQRRNQRQGLLMLAMVVLPMLIAYTMFKTGWGIPTGTVNKGLLLAPPQSVSSLSLTENNDALQRLYPAEKKQWRIMVPVTANCEAACQQNLYVTRQVHIRLAEKAARVERILLAIDKIPEEQKQQLLSEHPNILWLDSSRAALADWLTDTDFPVEQGSDHYFLIDQEGFAMMSYNTQHTGQDLLDDIKKLLKYTYEK